MNIKLLAVGAGIGLGYYVYEKLDQQKLDRLYAINLDRISYISTWNTECGIATYTRHLVDSLSEINHTYPNYTKINNWYLDKAINNNIVHIQHEFGIIPRISKLKDILRGKKVIITWHSVPNNIDNIIEDYRNNEINVVANIIHSRECFNRFNRYSSSGYIIPHGSYQFPNMDKETARKLLGLYSNYNLDYNRPIGFVFGFKLRNKNYKDLINAAISNNISLIISGAKNSSDKKILSLDKEPILFLDRFLTEEDVTLYTLASDMLLFDYNQNENMCSISGAIHRTIGSGRPIICNDITHFSCLENNKNCLKFKHYSELENCINLVINNKGISEQLGINAKIYAEETSWTNVAYMHSNIYMNI